VAQSLSFLGRSDASGNVVVQIPVDVGNYWSVGAIFLPSAVASTVWSLEVNGVVISQGVGIGAFVGVGTLGPGSVIRIIGIGAPASITIPANVSLNVTPAEPVDPGVSVAAWVPSPLGSGTAPPSHVSLLVTGANPVTIIAAPGAGFQLVLFEWQLAMRATGATGNVSLRDNVVGGNVILFCSPFMVSVKASLGGVVLPENHALVCAMGTVGDSWEAQGQYQISSVVSANQAGS